MSLVKRVLNNDDIIVHRGEFVKKQAAKLKAGLSQSVIITDLMMNSVQQQIHEVDESARKRLSDTLEQEQYLNGKQSKLGQNFFIPSIVQRTQKEWEKKAEEGKQKRLSVATRNEVRPSWAVKHEKPFVGYFERESMLNSTK